MRGLAWLCVASHTGSGWYSGLQCVRRVFLDALAGVVGGMVCGVSGS